MTEADKVFAAGLYDTPRGPVQTYYTSAVDRIVAVKRMTSRAQLTQALAVPDLQSSVVKAIQVQLRKLEAGK